MCRFGVYRRISRLSSFVRSVCHYGSLSREVTIARSSSVHKKVNLLILNFNSKRFLSLRIHAVHA